MPATILQVAGLLKSFGRVVVLNDISLDIHEGEIFGIIGVSGSGKTTLLNSMVGFLHPEKGDTRIILNRLLKLQGPDRMVSVYRKLIDVKKTFGFAAQTPSFYPELTVLENLKYFAALYNMTKESAESNIRVLLRFMELYEVKDLQSAKLSGGMQRRLDIACALVHNPPVLILDEPTADLDPVLAKQIWKLLVSINKRGTTIILSSHHLSELESFCTRIGILDEGRIVMVGSPGQIKENLSSTEEIHIETMAGNYKSLMAKLKDKAIISLEDRGTELVISTLHPEKVIHKVLHAIELSGDSLIDIKIRKPSLEEVFDFLEKK